MQILESMYSKALALLRALNASIQGGLVLSRRALNLRGESAALVWRGLGHQAREPSLYLFQL